MIMSSGIAQRGNSDGILEIAILPTKQLNIAECKWLEIALPRTNHAYVAASLDEAVIDVDPTEAHEPVMLIQAIPLLGTS